MVLYYLKYYSSHYYEKVFHYLWDTMVQIYQDVTLVKTDFWHKESAIYIYKDNAFLFFPKWLFPKAQKYMEKNIEIKLEN